MVYMEFIGSRYTKLEIHKPPHMESHRDGFTERSGRIPETRDEGRGKILAPPPRFML